MASAGLASPSIACARHRSTGGSPWQSRVGARSPTPAQRGHGRHTQPPPLGHGLRPGDSRSGRGH
eukprot:13548640-Alexandrium_andersonii.AAC.1